jgi:WD40 repeat protein/tRNA A-37 threonylcarbamoyl transferase component Bud32
MTVAADPRIGTELAGYRIEALLGRGGMGVVYLAEQLRLKRRVALKLLAPELADDDRFRERFLRESELAASIDHPNITPVYEAGEVEGLLYIAMRYVEGEDLKSLLAREGRLEPGRALAVLDQVAVALDAAHERGLVHRDVKPANILLAAGAGREHVYLSDFGITKRTDEDANLTDSGQFLGTADYVAPEQIEGGEIDGRADVYSLGCVLFECLVGESPFGSESKVGLLFAHLQKPPPSLTRVRADLPAAIDAVIAKAMAKQLADRYRTCGELAEAARAVMTTTISGGLPAALAAPTPPLIGREEELAWLRQAWSAARAGSGSLLLLAGPRGIGKTRLAAELAREAGAQETLVRYASCLVSDGAAPLVDAAAPEGGTALLVFEDLDAAQAPILEALESLVGEIDGKPLLVIGTLRTRDASPALESFAARLAARDGLRELPPLTAEEARRIAELHAGELAESFPVETALEATEGVPLRLHELAGEWTRAEVGRRMGTAAAQAAEERSSLREAEAAVAGNVVELQLVSERARLYFPKLSGIPGEKSRDMCPFKGLASFETADADYFFGRERLVAELVARLVGAGFLCVVGPSGSGKSSLLRAGLLPALAAGVLPGSERWRQVMLRPGDQPLAELGRALGSDEADPLAAAIGALGPGERLLLAVDQLEELFTSCSDETPRAAFADTLARAERDPQGRVIVAVALRADFFGRFAVFPDLARQFGANTVLVGPLQPEELRRAIELPAARVGLQVEPELADALVADVEDEPGGLPLLSTSLLELWQKRTDDTLTLAAYRESGGVQGAVARLAEGTYARVPEEHKPLVRAILLRLVGEGEGEAVVRRRAQLTELDLEHNQDASRVLSILADSRLVTVGDGTVEVAHEALLREWPRLRDWIQEDSQGRSLRRHITEAATEWDAAGHDEGALYRGARLAAALDYTAEHSAELNELERRFLEESRELSERETKRVRRTNRRLRGLLIGVAVLLAAAVAGGIYAVVQRGQARDAADKAEASALVAAASEKQARTSETHAKDAATAQLAQRLGANALVEDDLARSLLLAAQAFTIDDSPQTRSDLLAALQHNPAAIAVTHGNDDLSQVAASPDGRLLAMAQIEGNGGVFLFDAQSLKQVAGPLPTSFITRGLAFSPDGHTLAIAGSGTGEDGYVRLWDTQARATRFERSFRVARDPYDPRGTFGYVAYSPDGSLLATVEPQPRPDGSRGNWLLVFRDPTTGEQTGRPLDTGTGLLRFAFTPDGRSVLTSNEGKSTALVQWDLETRTVVRRFDGDAGAIAVRPDGRTVAIGRADGTVSLVDLRSQVEHSLSGRHSAAVNSLVFSPDGSTLATASADGTVIVWDVGSAAKREELKAHTASVQTAAFSPDGRTLYTASFDGTAIAWDMSGDRRLGRALAGDAKSNGGQFSPNGKLIAIGYENGSIGLWDAANGESLGTLGTPGPEPSHPVARAINVVQFSPDGTKLAALAANGNATIWDVQSRSLLRGPSAATSSIAGPVIPVVRFSPDGATLAVAAPTARVTLWDVATGSSLGALETSPAIDIAFDPTGTFLALALNHVERTEIWDLTHHVRVAGLPADLYGMFTVAYSPDGKLLATTGWEQTIRLWEPQPPRGKLVSELHQRDTGAWSTLDFSPDGSTLAAAGYEGNATLWDVKTGTQIGKLNGRSPGAQLTRVGTWAYFSPDGKSLLTTVSWDRRIVWDVDPQSWKRRACEIANRSLTQEEWDQFLPGRPYKPACTAGSG